MTAYCPACEQPKHYDEMAGIDYELPICKTCVSKATDEDVKRAVELAEGALLGTHPLREIWTDADYLCAILAVLTNGARARDALCLGVRAS